MARNGSSAKRFASFRLLGGSLMPRWRCWLSFLQAPEESKEGGGGVLRHLHDCRSLWLRPAIVSTNPTHPVCVIAARLLVLARLVAYRGEIRSPLCIQAIVG